MVGRDVGRTYLLAMIKKRLIDDLESFFITANLLSKNPDRACDLFAKLLKKAS